MGGPAVVGTLEESLDKVVAEALAGRDSLRQLAGAAGLDPSTDFRNMDLRGLDLRDEDLTGFDFSGADLTGCDFRRTKGLDADAFLGARILGAIGLPDEVRKRRGPDGSVGDADGFLGGVPDGAREGGAQVELRMVDGSVTVATVDGGPGSHGLRLVGDDGHAIDTATVDGWRPHVSPSDEPRLPAMR